MDTYKTAEIAAAIGIHPNTVDFMRNWSLYQSLNVCPTATVYSRIFISNNSDLPALLFKLKCCKMACERKSFKW